MRLTLVLMMTTAALAQQLPRPQAVQSYRQVVNLLESTSVAMPELGRAAAPLVENAR